MQRGLIAASAMVVRGLRNIHAGFELKMAQKPHQYCAYTFAVT
jgi:hypothetical protein